MRKKFGTLLLAGALCCSMLAGCGSSSTTTSDPASDSRPNPSAYHG